MKRFVAKYDFSKEYFDPNNFSVSKIYFTKGELYFSCAENSEYIIINTIFFYVSEKDMKYCKPSDYAEIFIKDEKTSNYEILNLYKRFTDYFYTDKELRKLKLQQINERR